QDPAEFFARTYLTEGMRRLLQSAARRVTGAGGEPVIQVKTAFGGGKTHSMLALYHLLGGQAPAERLAGVPELLGETGLDHLPQARLAVLVGTALDATRPRPVKGLKRVQVRTLWGELAAQLGGAEGYALVETADKSGVSPGADTLVELFAAFGPCLVLVDELVAYCRNLYGASGLPGGSFDANMTFVQALTEAIRRSGASQVVASIPESAVEIGGEAGQAALARLEQVFGRMEAVWMPVGVVESFEIVRRRLFTPVKDEAGREETCRAFSRMYAGADAADFPPDSRHGAYLDRLRGAYPIHPELFDRLYDDWSTLENFQRTRGVLRLMAAVIHELWARDDRSLLIMPGSLPLDAQAVREELTRYLREGWDAVVDKDVDGPRSEPRRIDEGNPRLGAHLAARKVARAVFLGSAPSVKQQAVRGIEDVRVRLGVVQPGEPVALFNDALSRLGDRLTYLYQGNRRYWYDTQPNLRRTMEDRASRLEPHEVHAEIERRLGRVRDRGDFHAVHLFSNTADIPDDAEARLVVLGPQYPYHRARQDNPALLAAIDTLHQRGYNPRSYANMLVFVAPDEGVLAGLDQETRRCLAWKSIADDAEALNLDAHQARQAAQSLERSDETVDLRIHEAYAWLLVPAQEGANPVEWQALRIAGGSESFVQKAAKKLRGDELLITRWSPALLRIELDRWLWKDAPHLGLKKLWDYLGRYVYLPRLRDAQVLLRAIEEGLGSRDYFAYAGAVTPEGRYQGLVFGERGSSVHLDDASVLVKPEAARRQLEADAAAVAGRAGAAPAGELAGGLRAAQDGGVEAAAPGRAEAAPAAGTERPRRFHGVVRLDAARVARDAGRVADEVVQHLVGQLGAEVEVSLEIHAHLPGGAPDTVVLTVSENARTLRFESFGFESE
ncbi:MAG: ATP-binding protein, partial [Anaerolineales bacterium]|nr:ATP-binding protein [Anaerolineales bacterium]